VDWIAERMGVLPDHRDPTRPRPDTGVPVDSTPTIQVRLDRSKPGSIEHFWHFLFGVAFPLLDFHRRNPDRLRGARLELESCGPVMDRVLPPLFRGLGLDLAAAPAPTAEPAGDEPDRARWIASLADGCIRLPRWDQRLETAGISDAAFAESIRATAAFVAAEASGLGCCRETTPSDGYLLLRRSPEPDYYGPGGGADAKGYGTGRRELSGLEPCLEALAARGIPAAVYEPGAHELACQIRHFARARGVIGLRGAELANLAWMRPEAVVLMLCWTSPRTPPQRLLAAALGIGRYRELELREGRSGTLDADLIVRTLLAIDPGAASTGTSADDPSRPNR
jgi:hypothetical protein